LRYYISNNKVNSCPSGLKSMPYNENQQTEYTKLIENTFLPLGIYYFKSVKQAEKDELLPKGGLAVLFDKNLMENSGYAATIADLFKENCYLVECYDKDENSCHRFKDGILEILFEKEWIPIRACFRYVTQR
jgi:hypothetical protein